MDDRKKDLCLYRLEKAEKCLSSAKALVQLEDYCSAVNRSYYSIFHGIRGLLALDGVDFSKHKCAVFHKWYYGVREYHYFFWDIFWKSLTGKRMIYLSAFFAQAQPDETALPELIFYNSLIHLQIFLEKKNKIRINLQVMTMYQ